jgi:hypothetical protein
MRACGEGLLAGALGCSLVGACTEEPRTYSTRGNDGTEIFRDEFDGSELGPHWHATAAEGVVVEHGVVKVKELKNHPLWLDVALPDDVRIELDVWAQDEEGDVKIELAGDGKSVATSVNYIASGYVLVFGGWNNTLHVIARKNEHGRDRATATEPTVTPGRRYHFVITRSGGDILWEVDGKELLSFEDPTPLRGAGHDRFALSAWDAETHFDNVVIEAL